MCYNHNIPLLLFSTPSASIEFLGKGADALNLNLSRALQRSLCHDGVLDWNSLTITGKSIWIIKLDAIVLQIGGNLEDVLSIAARAALFNTKFPKVEINDLGDGQVDFEPVVDEQDLQCLDISNVPIALTLHRVTSLFISEFTFL